VKWKDPLSYSIFIVPGILPTDDECAQAPKLSYFGGAGVGHFSYFLNIVSVEVTLGSLKNYPLRIYVLSID